MHSQEKIKQIILPLIHSKGQRYKKFKNVFARKAKPNETICTITHDGKETTNCANVGDFIIKNQTNAKEEYILTPEKFRSRYAFKKRAKEGFSEYEPKGRIHAIEVTKRLLSKFNVKTRFYFEAAWGSKMVVKEKDFLVCPLQGEEVYRIARKEFFETYRKES